MRAFIIPIENIPQDVNIILFFMLIFCVPFCFADIFIVSCHVDSEQLQSL